MMIDPNAPSGDLPKPGEEPAHEETSDDEFEEEDIESATGRNIDVPVDNHDVSERLAVLRESGVLESKDDYQSKEPHGIEQDMSPFAQETARKEKGASSKNRKWTKRLHRCKSKDPEIEHKNHANNAPHQDDIMRAKANILDTMMGSRTNNDTPLANHSLVDPSFSSSQHSLPGDGMMVGEVITVSKTEEGNVAKEINGNESSIDPPNLRRSVHPRGVRLFSFLSQQQEQEQNRPGAHRVRGRGVGPIPVWARTAIQQQNGGDHTVTFSDAGQSRTTTINRRRRSSDGLFSFGYLQNRNNVQSSSQSLAEAQMVTDSEVVVYASDVNHDDTVRKRRMVMSAGAICLVVICVLIGVVMWLVAFHGQSPTVDRCDDPKLRNDIITICVCQGSAASYRASPVEELAYTSLQTAFLELGIIDRRYERDSCQPENQALLFTASFNEQGGFGLNSINFLFIRAIAQRYALIMIYIAFDGYGWKDNTGWLQPGLVCEWHGIQCSFLERITTVSLPQNGLVGTFPRAIGEFSFLETLDLSQNPGIHGTLPNTLPKPILHSLHDLNLAGTSLEGPLPSFIGEMEVLDNLVIANATINGTIPTGFGRLTRLQELSLRSNQLSGTIPAELGNLTNLVQIDVRGNQLSGTLPNLSSLQFLELLDLRDNQFDGQIPSFLGQLERLNAALLSDNRFVGTVPETFCNSSKPALGFDYVLVDCSGPFVVERNCSCCNLRDIRGNFTNFEERQLPVISCRDDFQESIRGFF